jgi:hypothetical protein
MAHVTLAQVRSACAEGRFFRYHGWRDRLFVPPSIFLVWIFVRCGWSGNAVSLLSGAIAVAGGWLLASSDRMDVMVGSLGYVGFYLLDYVDGGVARVRGESGISGQYVDWAMHVVSAVSIWAGIFAGALAVAGAWIIPFGLLTVVAAALSLDRYSLAWFAICMHHQQQRAKGIVEEPRHGDYRARRRSRRHRTLRNLSTAVFHENYAFFVVPGLALIHLIASPALVDFRVILVLLGGVLYFPVMVYDIWLIAAEGRVDNAYRKLFFGEQSPRLPEDHFLE